MTCCGAAEAALSPTSPEWRSPLDAHVRREGGAFHLDLSVPGVHCAGCIARIERAVGALPGVDAARVNVSRKTLSLVWRDPAFVPDDAVAALSRLGYDAVPLDVDETDDDPHGRMLLTSLAVAGFAAMNVMLLSVSVWAGADGATRDLLHWFSALIAVPAAVYAGRPFYRSAWGALRQGALNMDVPITLAVLLACGLSLHETLSGGAEAYFDAAVTLLFFLLAGRVLEHRVRTRMRASLSHLTALTPRTATLVHADGHLALARVDAVEAGAHLRIAAGDRVPLDGVLLTPGRFDLSHATGEVKPVALAAGETVVAGAVALSGPLDLRAIRVAEESFVSRMRALLAAAENVRPAQLLLADRAARLYTPLVHLVALGAALGWLAAGADLHQALTVAVATLIITCPCALGLAVPAVQAVACEVLFRAGVMVKDGAALERLRGVDTVLLDKTGTLTRPRVGARLPDDRLRAAAALAVRSRHPFARALVAEARRRGVTLPEAKEVEERHGEGVLGIVDGREARLGSGGFVGAAPDAGLALRLGGGAPVAIDVEEELRPGAHALVQHFRAAGAEVGMLTGDVPARAKTIGVPLGISFEAGLSPGEKLARIEGMTRRGHKVLMIGDGLNDGPALAAAHASMAPGDASDLSRVAADFVLLDGTLEGAVLAARVSRAADRHILQNFALAALYNALAVPLAVAGLATPLHAAVAMSTSSVLVTLNALRLRWSVRGSRAESAAAPARRPAFSRGSTAEVRA